ncbi:AMP-binding protein [Streptomyces sp. NPDC015171]|uniref:non-ribosomal peptide synthetase n=1 Tax=Streptomyces sp. NPDC015171 TaxID=3364945 RepID=UPI0036F79CAE
MEPTVPAMVEEHARTRPHAAAITRGAQRLDYGELNRRANVLAARLTARGVRRGTVVGVHLGRSAEWVVGMLAVLKLGAVCMSLDPKAPAERTARAIRSAAPAVVLTGTRDGGEPPGTAPVLSLDDLADDPGDPGDPGVEIHQDDLAFAMHTSGSSGRAKIVLAQHSWLTHGVATGVAVNRTTAADRGSWLAPAGAGIAVHEVCMLLWAGAALHIAEPETVASPPALRAWLLEHRITQTFVVTPVGETLQTLDWPAGTELRLMSLGGDKLNGWAPAGLPFEVAVSYGSLEAFQIANSLHPWERRCTPATATAADRAAPPPVGRPLPGVTVHLLEEDLTPVAPGAIGEVWVDSPALSLGYLGNPALTADKFRPDPFGAPGGRLYRTGDAGRLRPDGVLEHRGRIDDVVKIRGHRVEVGEVEWALGRHPRVTRVCVVGVPEDGQHQLVACLVTDGPVSPRELRAHAAAQLQDFMVPVAYVLMDRLPVNTSDKIDRRALPPADWRTWRPSRPYREPRGETALGLASLVAELLAVERVGADDNFFELGGDSLLAAQLQTRIEERFGIRLRMEDLMAAETLTDLAERVVRTGDRGGRTDRLPPIVRRSRS